MADITITEKDWETLSEKQKTWLLYRSITSIKADIKRVALKPMLSRSCSVIGGIVGGIMAYFGIILKS